MPELSEKSLSAFWLVLDIIIGMEHEAWFFVGLFVFIFLIWIAVGGPTRGFSLGAPALSFGSGTSTPSGSSFSLSLPRAPYGIGTSDAALPEPSSGNFSYGSAGGGTNPALFGVAYGTPSPYRGIVSMSHYVSGAGASDPDGETLSVTVSAQAGVPVDLTGWTLESGATGAASPIPQGTKVPMSGIVAEGQDIVLEPGEQAIIISGRSPIGASFEENGCIGYFAQFQHFSPSLPIACPAPADELSAHYANYIRDASCIDYVNTLSRCQAVLSPPTTVSGSCQSFLLTYLNYDGCIAAHKDDVNFGGTQWRIYLGRTAPLFRSSHEVVKLVDTKGNTVDAFSY